ncbi:hypothetical protein [Paenibacillus sp. PL2-23]|uniref:hypothetical protein n=1 Tax=Paenibacillus sp. PL2-23 TaxID=2100729 RepID=UPI0030FB7DA9
MYRSLVVRAVCLSAVILLSLASYAFAAPFELSPTAKSSFDRMVAGADAKAAAELKRSYSELQALQGQEISLDQKISALHYKNEERSASLRKEIKSIDSAKLRSLELSLEQTERRYEPLFELYSTHKSQLSIAKVSKNKELIAFASAQAEITKAAVKAANASIDAKEAALKKAKSEAAAKMKAVRDLLSAAETPETRIKAAKSSASSTKKLFVTESKILLQNVRKLDAPATSLSLSRMLLYQRQILAQRVKAYEYEGQIGAIIGKAEALLKTF